AHCGPRPKCAACGGRSVHDAPGAVGLQAGGAGALLRDAADIDLALILAAGLPVLHIGLPGRRLDAIRLGRIIRLLGSAVGLRVVGLRVVGLRRAIGLVGVGRRLAIARVRRAGIGVGLAIAIAGIAGAGVGVDRLAIAVPVAATRRPVVAGVIDRLGGVVRRHR